jgi:tripartite-type tricarboxylate transporter receptor subunit TctC
MPYNDIKDFSPVSFLASMPNLLVVNNAVATKTVKELIVLVGRTPLTFGSSGCGTSIHLSEEFFNILARGKIQHAPCNGGAQAVSDFLGEQITMIFDNMPSVLPLVKSVNVRAIAVTSFIRSAAAPTISTMPSPVCRDLKPAPGLPCLPPPGYPGMCRAALILKLLHKVLFAFANHHG